mmetsp:Transcript_20473/g.25873  ORF Transcript_20473/g.25873 Transcript_20473/m.25873 type:complete len:289 (-) Transcript_20473:6-872(-)
MKPFSTKSIAIGAIVATLLSKRGLKKKSLSQTGAITAWIVGFFSIACGNRGFLLLLFYQLGTMVTKFKREHKVKKDGDASKSSVRSPYQVLACSGIAVLISLVHALLYGEEKPIDFDSYPMESSLTCGIIAHYCTCCGDTFASEIGILSRSKPVLITAPWRKVPNGTNGGVSFWGTLWSAIGGSAIGIGCILLDKGCSGMDDVYIIEMILFSTLCGLLGSFLDSILGATLQATYYDEDKKLVYCEKDDAPPNAKCISGANCLTNAQVNLLSVLATTLIGGFYVAPAIF